MSKFNSFALLSLRRKESGIINSDGSCPFSDELLESINFS